MNRLRSMSSETRKGEALTPIRWAGGITQGVGWIAVEVIAGYDGRRWLRGLTEEEWYGTRPSSTLWRCG